MITRSSNTARHGGSLLRMVAVFGLCLSLAACGESTSPGSGGKTGGLGDPGNKKTVAYGISVSMPKGWSVMESVDPGTVSNAELESRIKTNPVPLLALGLPSTTNPQQGDAIVLVFLADSAKNMPPEQVVSQMTQEGMDQLAKNTMQQQNEAAKKAKQPGQTLEWKITRENLNGHMALFNNVLGQGPNGNVRAHMWYIYLPNGIGIGIESKGNAAHPGIDAMMESIARSLTVSQAK